jgi:general stress protein YciG
MLENQRSREAGQRGGWSTVATYGADHMAEIGQRGAESFRQRYVDDPDFRARHLLATKFGIMRARRRKAINL